jgi:uncharacterized membrane protein
VFAIAITLLVLEIGIPRVDSGADLGYALRHQWPSYFAYVVSFVTIGIMWWNHHELFEDLIGSDHTLMLLNLLLLLCIAFVPFPTSVLAEHLDDGDIRGPAAAFYAGSFTLTAIAYNALWLYCLRSGVLGHHVTSRAAARTTRRYLLGPVAYGLATVVAFASALLSLAIIGGLALLYLLPYGDPDADE